MFPVTISWLCWSVQTLCVSESIIQRATNHGQCRKGRQEREFGHSGLQCVFVCAVWLKKAHIDLCLTLCGEENVRQIQFLRSTWKHSKISSYIHLMMFSQYTVYDPRQVFEEISIYRKCLCVWVCAYRSVMVLCIDGRRLMYCECTFKAPSRSHTRIKVCVLWSEGWHNILQQKWKKKRSDCFTYFNTNKLVSML